MPGNSAYLHSLKKTELQELADLVDLKGTSGYKKAELEAAVDKYLASHSSTLSKDPRFDAYYHSNKSSSPVKKEAASTAVLTDSESKPKARARKVSKAITDAMSAAEESSPDTSRALAAVRNTPRTALNYAQSIPLPPSPAQIANAFDRQTAIYRTKASQAWNDAGVTEGAHTVRETLSSVVSIEFLVTSLEALGLALEVLPLRYAFTIPAITLPLLQTSAWPVALPDLFLLLTSHFWQPFILWTSTSILLPLLFSYFINLTLLKPKTVPITRNTAVGPSYTFDPLIFNIAKALFTYMVYTQGQTLGGFATSSVVKRINGAVPAEGVLIGTGIGVLVSLYDAAIKK